MAIGIKLHKNVGDHDLAASKFFGIPTLPEGILENISDDAVFVAQIKLTDIIKYDVNNELPHEGYLYFFLETPDDSPYTYKNAIVIHSLEKPTIAVDDFNLASPMSEGLNEDYLIEFFNCDDDYDGIKLLGNPYDYNYCDETKLLLQFDPLDTLELDFFSQMDGYIYYFYGKRNKNFKNCKIHFEYS